MDLINLDLEKYKPLAIEAFTHVYGEKYKEIISKKIMDSIIIKYNNIDGLDTYIRSLKEIKAYQLARVFLKKIGCDTTKYDKKREIELVDDYEFYNLCRDYLGSLFCCFEKKNTVPVFTLEKDKSNFIFLINRICGKERVNKYNLNKFKETDEYKEILNIVDNYKHIYDELANEYEEYKEKFSLYQKYIDDDKERKSKIYEEGIKRIIKKIYHLLPDFLKEKFDNTTLEEKIKILFGDIDDNNFTAGLQIDFFNKENIDELYSSNIDSYKKWIIGEFQASYFRNFNIDLPDKRTMKFNTSEDLNTYLSFFEREDVKSIIPSQDLIDKIHEICDEEAEICLNKYYIERDDFKEIVDSFGFSNPDANNWLLYYFKNKLICITSDGGTKDGNYASVMFYTIRNNSLGNMANNYLHELGHVCDDNFNKLSGIEIDDCSIRNPYNSSKRKYEVFNEALNDIFTIEAEEYLNSCNIYLFEDKEHTYPNHYRQNMGELTKDILKSFVLEYRDYIIEAKINSDQSILTDYIGKDNFEELNDIVNKIEFLCGKDLKSKLEKQYNDNCEEVREYNKQIERLKKVYSNIEIYISNNYMV